MKVRAERLGVPFRYFTKEEWKDGTVLGWLREEKIDFVILAGFLLKVPVSMIQEFPNRIVNIHPALLPKYGGKGMYGMHVHEAVVAAGEKESGISIHYVNENLDAGQVIFQAKVKVAPTDTPEDVAHNVHELEYEYFPKVIAQVIGEAGK